MYSRGRIEEIVDLYSKKEDKLEIVNQLLCNYIEPHYPAGSPRARMAITKNELFKLHLSISKMPDMAEVTEQKKQPVLVKTDKSEYYQYIKERELILQKRDELRQSVVSGFQDHKIEKEEEKVAYIETPFSKAVSMDKILEYAMERNSDVAEVLISMLNELLMDCDDQQTRKDVQIKIKQVRDYFKKLAAPTFINSQTNNGCQNFNGPVYDPTFKS